MEWQVRQATIEDVKDIAPRLRQSDVDEIKACSGNTPLDSLTKALELPSLGMWVGVYKGRAEVIFGCSHTPDQSIGVPWMVSTDVVRKSPRGFLQLSKRWLAGFSRQYPVLKNFVAAKNELHVRWLKWMGFEFTQLHEEHGVGKEPFWEFEMRQKEI